MAEKDYPVRLSGHALIGEGIAAYPSGACDQEECGPREFEGRDRGSRLVGGHARCSCGAESEHLASQGKRQRWHQGHKREIAQRATETNEGKP